MSTSYLWSHGAIKQFIVVKRTLEFLVRPNVCILRYAERLIAAATVESTRLGLNELHVSTAFATPDSSTE